LPDLKSKEIKIVEELIYKGKFEEALNTISEFEKKTNLTSKIQLSIYILKGRIFKYSERYREAVDMGELAFQLSQKLGIVSSSIDALLIKACIVFFGELENALDLISEVENMFNSFSGDSTSHLSRQKTEFLLVKSLIYRFTGDLDKAFDLALQWGALGEKIGEKLDVSLAYIQIGNIHLFRGKPNRALDYAKKSLILQKELDNPVGIATSLALIGFCYYSKGDFDLSLKYCKKVIIVKEVSNITKHSTLHVLGAIYKEKGELNRTLSYYNRAAKLAVKHNNIEGSIEDIMGIGTIYRMKGDHDKATEYLNRSLALSESINSQFGMRVTLFYLILLSLDKNSRDEALQYLEKLEKLSDQTESSIFRQGFLIAKALVLKQSNRIRNRSEAETMLKKIIESEFTTPQLYLLAIVNLCDLLLEELIFTNNPEVLDELYPLITKILKISEKQNSYLWLAETKLLQAKLALIQMKMEEAKQLFTQSQQIAELHGLNLLAIKISSEHDNLLEQLNLWDNLEEKNAPMSERIKLASLNGVLDRMKGKRVVDPPNLKHEMPVLLLVIAEGGIPLFSNSFTEDWSFEDDLISGFLTAFNTFSGELFSNKLDRAKFGDYTILMQAVNPFSVCYLFKGQTFLAKQKFTQFIDLIQKSPSLWQKMIKFSITNRSLRLKDSSTLELLITEIFIKKAKIVKPLLNE